MNMRELRRKDRAIEDREEMIDVLRKVKHITIAICKDNMPYLVTLSHGYDNKRNAIYFHCAREGKKIEILKSNNVVWGQALIDKGYVYGKCSHHYVTTQFKGTVKFIDNLEEKRHALITMIRQLDPNPEDIIKDQITEESLESVNIGRIDIKHLSGKAGSRARSWPKGLES